MTPKIIWRYRRKRHTPSASRTRKPERGPVSAESRAAGGMMMQRTEQKKYQAAVGFTGDEKARASVQFKMADEEQAQAKIQLKGEDEEQTQAKVQLKAEDEEQAQARVQLKKEDEEDVQAKSEPMTARSGRLIRSLAKSGFAGNPGSYPFRHRIQAAFGRHTIANVKAFSDAAASTANRRLGAVAYASSERVAFRGYPDLHTAAHEAAHIIQQRQGVSPKDGTGTKDDPYERHADAVADRVVQGASVESLLDRSPASSGKETGLRQQEKTKTD